MALVFFPMKAEMLIFFNSDDGGTAGELTEREFEFEDANSN